MCDNRSCRYIFRDLINKLLTVVNKGHLATSIFRTILNSFELIYQQRSLHTFTGILNCKLLLLSSH